MHELFYRDSYAREFDAEVVSCKEGKKGCEVVLNDTAFYPEGGGQPADHGTLGDAKVLDVKRRDGVIIHYTDKPLTPGDKVHGKIDWDRRFDFMQQHSGEHIFSGFVHTKFGYDNVGFHLSEDTVTVDFNGAMTWEEAMEIEEEVNHYIWENHEMKVLFPSQEELKAIDYRSKKELKGEVRLVEFPGADLCACCGTHIARTGEIGLFKILSVMKHRGGVRLEIASGGRAMADYRHKHEMNQAISAMLSVKPDEIDAGVKRYMEERAADREKMMAMNERYFQIRIHSIEMGAPGAFFLEEGMTPFEIRKFCEQILESKRTDTAMVISPKEEGSFNYVLGSGSGKARDWGKKINEELHGRGGGKPEMVQGSFQASPEMAEKVFAQLTGGAE